MWKKVRLCIPKKSVSVRVYSDDDKTIADRFNHIFLTSVKETTYQKLKQLTNECYYAPAQQTCSPEFPRASEQFIFAKKGSLYIVWMLKRLYHHCLQRILFI